MTKAVAICSCPRLGFMDFMGVSIAAFVNNRIGYHNAFGVYWDQSLAEAMRGAQLQGFDYVFTCDYDSIFNTKDVARLLDLMVKYPEADAITSMQMGRFHGLLLHHERKEITREEFQADLVPMDRGHFGLTVFKVAALEDLKKPWFLGKPNSNGDWERGSDKTDPDIYFWDNFKKSGKKLFVSPRTVIGHLELMIKWPDQNLTEMYQKASDYQSTGEPPGDLWT